MTKCKLAILNILEALIHSNYIIVKFLSDVI